MRISDATTKTRLKLVDEKSLFHIFMKYHGKLSDSGFIRNLAKTLRRLSRIRQMKSGSRNALKPGTKSTMVHQLQHPVSHQICLDHAISCSAAGFEPAPLLSQLVHPPRHRGWQNFILLFHQQVLVVDRPSAPLGPFDAYDITPDTCTLSWKQPLDDGGSPITNYVVEKMDSNGVSTH